MPDYVDPAERRHVRESAAIRTSCGGHARSLPIRGDSWDATRRWREGPMQSPLTATEPEPGITYPLGLLCRFVREPCRFLYFFDAGQPF
jgi:hypothetical protein